MDIFENGKNGFIINKLNSSSIKQKLEAVLENPTICKKLAFSNRRYAGKHFKEDQYIRNIEETFL